VTSLNVAEIVFWVERREFQNIPEVSEKHIASIFREEEEEEEEEEDFLKYHILTTQKILVSTITTENPKRKSYGGPRHS
jgi:hypothetical protein